MSVLEEMQIARALLSVLDGHIEALRQQDQMNRISSEKQFFIYTWRALDFVTDFDNLTVIRPISKTLNLQPDAAFVADGILLAVEQNDGDETFINCDQIELIDNYTGRVLTEGLTSERNVTNSVPLQIFPNASGLVPYVWFDLPSEFLLPRGGSLTVRSKSQVGHTGRVTVALRGYKVFQE